MRLIANCLFAVFVVNLTSLAYGQSTNGESKTGTFIIYDTVKGILGKEAATDISKLIDVNEVIKWKLTVPASYNSDKPFGVVYFSNYGDGDRLPIGWERSFSEKNIIVVRSMDDVYDSRSHAIVNTLSFAIVQKYYNISSNRIYILGTRNGCQAAIDTALAYPNIIKGTILANCIGKFEFYKNDNLEHSINQNPFLYVKNQNLREYSFSVDWDSIMKKYGIKNASYKSYSGTVRGSNLNRRQLNLSIDFLDDEPQK